MTFTLWQGVVLAASLLAAGPVSILIGATLIAHAIKKNADATSALASNTYLAGKDIKSGLMTVATTIHGVSEALSPEVRIMSKGEQASPAAVKES